MIDLVLFLVPADMYLNVEYANFTTTYRHPELFVVPKSCDSAPMVSDNSVPIGYSDKWYHDEELFKFK